MKKRILALLVFCLLLSGCAEKPAEDKESGTADIQQESSETGDKDADDSALTPEKLEMLAAKHGSLSLEDFEPYLDLSSLETNGSLWETVEFTYNGKKMYLRVSASDKDIAAAPYEGDLDGAVVFSEEFLGLETLEQQYAYEGSCADIRSGSLQHILDGAVVMEDYLTVTLPEGFEQSDFKFWMGSHGGTAILKDGHEKVTVENAGIYAEKPLPGGIEIWGNGELNQGMETVKELEPLKINGTVTLRRVVLQTEQGTKWYAAYTEQEGSTISYCFYLNAQDFTEAEFLKISDTLELMENAIY